MNDFNSEGSGENEWEDRGELAWNEFDWERYLREQDATIQRYVGFYEAFRDHPDRIDAVADQMGWDRPEAGDDSEADEDSAALDEADEFIEEDEIYTLHKNPVFIATKAIYLGLRSPWERTASDADPVPRSLALSFLASLHRGEENAVHAVHALDFGDFAMAISLFKRALGAINESLSFLDEPATERHPALRPFRANALPRLFDLREIWLRVINECRQELNRPIDEES
jgi:hypothetical protein